MMRKNPDGSISVGILDDFENDMNPPVIEDAKEEAVVEEKPKKNPARAKKTAKK